MNEKTKSGAGAHSSLQGLESGLGEGLRNLPYLSNRCGSVGGWWGQGWGGEEDDLGRSGWEDWEPHA